jgi:hypothetical protein
MSSDTSFSPTSKQAIALTSMLEFAKNDDKAFILRGYAGTGKTTLVRLYIRQLDKLHIKYCLLASTGRAAKVLSNITHNSEASTVHSLIYKFHGFNSDIGEMAEKNKASKPTGQLRLDFGLEALPSPRRIIYIIDEASMISDADDSDSGIQASFGSGRLLTDLFAYNRDGKFLFVGDVCQLPPINQASSPALSDKYLADEFHITVKSFDLTEIVRQDKGCDIAQASHAIRHLYLNPQPFKWAKYPLRGYSSIHLVSSESQLISAYIDCIKHNGFEQTSMICFSNRQCDIIKTIVRPALGLSNGPLTVGDMLIVTQNSYVSPLMNGDIVKVINVGGRVTRAGISFLRVTLEEAITKHVHSQLLIENVLYDNVTNVTSSQQKELFFDFYYRMKEINIHPKTDEFYFRMMSDEYLNALRAVFAFALTCHKAQGGEWDNVFLNIPRNLPAMTKPYTYQWVYTAITRAKKNLFIVDDFWIP